MATPREHWAPFLAIVELMGSVRAEFKAGWGVPVSSALGFGLGASGLTFSSIAMARQPPH
jgi:hypothetical protein